MRLKRRKEGSLPASAAEKKDTSRRIALSDRDPTTTEKIRATASQFATTAKNKATLPTSAPTSETNHKSIIRSSDKRRKDVQCAAWKAGTRKARAAPVKRKGRSQLFRSKRRTTDNLSYY